MRRAGYALLAASSLCDAAGAADIRIATFNASLNRNAGGDLVRDAVAWTELVVLRARPT